MRAVGYFRVSDADQVEGWSLDAQKRACDEFCKAKGWEIVGYYNEEGRSAWGETVAKRPAFRRLLQDSETRSFDVVITHTLDRFSRNLRVMLDAFQVFSKNNVTYVSIQQEIDYTKPEGKLFMMMLGAFAQYFSDALSGHTKKGMKERAQQGLFNGEPPYGYERCDAECFGIDEHPGCHIIWEKASLVQTMFAKYATGTCSLSDLALWMNENGAKTNYRHGAVLYDGSVSHEPRSFTVWSVRGILRNRFYIGEVSYRDEHYPGRHQALVDEPLFDEVQKTLSRSQSRTHGRSQAKHDYVLQGLARCVRCSEVMWSQSIGRAQRAYYRERPSFRGGKCERPKSVRADALDFQLEQIFNQIKLRPDWQTRITERIVDRLQRDDIVEERSHVESRQRRLRDLYLEGDITKKFYDDNKRDMQERLDTLVIPEVDITVMAGEMVENLGELWKEADIQGRNQLLTSMVHAVFIDAESKTIAGVLPRPGFREVLLCVDGSEGITIYDPAEEGGSERLRLDSPFGESNGSAGGDGGGSNSPSRRLPNEDILQA